VSGAIGRMLRTLGDPIIAESVGAAHAVIANRPSLDGLVSDLRLPDGSGLEVVRAFARVNPGAPMLLLTGHVESSVVNEAFDLGVPVLGKPADARRICGLLAGNKMEGAGNRAEPVVEVALARRLEELRSQDEGLAGALARHAVGTVVAELKRRPGGAQALVRASVSCGESLASLYRWARVVECWSAVDVERLISQKAGGEHYLTWSHLVALAGIRDPDTRAAYVAMALEEGLSARRLAARIAKSGASVHGSASDPEH
jgi:CheY-like chemotaxis protein